MRLPRQERSASSSASRLDGSFTMRSVVSNSGSLASPECSGLCSRLKLTTVLWSKQALRQAAMSQHACSALAVCSRQAQAGTPDRLRLMHSVLPCCPATAALSR